MVGIACLHQLIERHIADPAEFILACQTDGALRVIGHRRRFSIISGVKTERIGNHPLVIALLAEAFFHAGFQGGHDQRACST